MGTRGIYGWVTGDTEVICYNQYDSYPDGLGVDIVKYVAAINDIEATRVAVRSMVRVGNDTPPTEEQIQNLSRYANTNVGETNRPRLVLPAARGAGQPGAHA